MTRVDLSPETLNALAARPERPLEEMIEDHRYLYRADLFLSRLHGSDGGGRTSRYWGDVDPGRAGPSGKGSIGWTGLEFSNRFSRYIDWDRREQQEGVRPSHPGQSFPWSTAFYAQWAECRRFHREHYDRPEWRGSLCRQMVSFTIRREFGLEATCLVLGVTPPRAGRTLRNALLWIEGYMDHQQDRQKQGATPVQERVHWREPAEHQRHDIPGMHATDCPQCQNGAA